ncbi:hypothetical protein NDU88_004567 [Pleurodeles waltl]|uniref:Uncharacterized protein n=1 Tax=Pleurodeles waltl TaxID=8319 RepID=A0AAV7QFN8_PLEWA|nr:hypothetical protein NDU88_004567 [Pleurodeles waltl]
MSAASSSPKPHSERLPLSARGTGLISGHSPEASWARKRTHFGEKPTVGAAGIGALSILEAVPSEILHLHPAEASRPAIGNSTVTLPAGPGHA